MYKPIFFAALLRQVHSAALSTSSLTSSTAAISASTTVITTTVTIPPQYFQTTPELYAGETATAGEPFLAESNPAPFPAVSYVPPSPLETQEPVFGNKHHENIFHQMGNLSPYFASPGFGIDEIPLPQGANISWVNMLARHGSRYPTDPIALGAAIANATHANFSSGLSFLNSWKYNLGVNILTPSGRQELYDNGVLHNYLYGQLYNPNNGSKLLVRTTTQDRMVKSAENFLAGFFGLGWTANATLELIIDEPFFNNSLAGYNVCLNNDDKESGAGAIASEQWIAIYLADAVKRFNSMSTGFKWTASSVYDAQQLCPYETIALGYSSFCDLFTYDEWLGFEQSIDLDFAGTYGFQSPTGRAVGIGYVEEVLARINHHLITTATGSVNVTLDNMTSTFPLYQTLNFDFSHDVNIASVLTAFGLKQFAPYFSPTHYDPKRALIVSHMEPFGARLDIELIDTPHPVNPSRTSKKHHGYPSTWPGWSYGNSSSFTSGGNWTTPGFNTTTSQPDYLSGGKTTYIHFVLNQRTLPLGASYPACGQRTDGWCELQTWLNATSNALQLANYNTACFGNYTPPTFGQISNGAPI